MNIVQILEKFLNGLFGKKVPNKTNENIPRESNPKNKTLLHKPQKISFGDMKEGIRLLLCECEEGRYPEIVDMVTIIYIDKERDTIKVKNNSDLETKLSLEGDLKFLIMHEDPFTGDSCVSIRGPYYTFFTF